MLTVGEVWTNAGYLKADASDTSAFYIAMILICSGIISSVYVWMNQL